MFARGSLPQNRWSWSASDSASKSAPNRDTGARMVLSSIDVTGERHVIAQWQPIPDMEPRLRMKLAPYMEQVLKLMAYAGLHVPFAGGANIGTVSVIHGYRQVHVRVYPEGYVCVNLYSGMGDSSGILDTSITREGGWDRVRYALRLGADYLTGSCMSAKFYEREMESKGFYRSGSLPR